jgi:hypothetical protein
MGKPSNPAGLVTEKDILIALVSSIIARHMVTYTVDEHSLHASGHPHADITEELSRRLSLADGSVKQDLLLSQQGIYTAVQEPPDYKPWRTATAKKLTACLLRDLDGLLSMALFWVYHLWISTLYIHRLHIFHPMNLLPRFHLLKSSSDHLIPLSLTTLTHAPPPRQPQSFHPASISHLLNPTHQTHTPTPPSYPLPSRDTWPRRSSP